MKLDMVSTYVQSCNMDQSHMYNTNQFVYSNNQPQPDSTNYMPRYNDLDSFYSNTSFTATTQPDLCQNQLVHNQTSLAPIVSHQSSYLSLNNKKLKLSDSNETLTLTPPTSTNSLLNDEVKNSNTMHTTIDFNLIDYTTNQSTFNQNQKHFYASNMQPMNQYQPMQQQQQQQYSFYNNQMPLSNQQYVQTPTTFSSSQQFDFKNQDKKVLKTTVSPNYPVTNKKEVEHYEEFISEEDEEDEEEEDDDEDEDEEEYDDDDSLLKHQHKRLKKQIDNENDYEIKHNCLTEDGAYSLFNSPSSLSSSSANNQDSLRGSQTVKHFHVKEEKNKSSAQQTALIVAKTEQCDDLTDLQRPESRTLKETHNISKLTNQQQQQINNMINSYSMAGIMNDYDLVNLPLRELNKRLRSLPKQMAYNMKKRRRTLKNRKYAQNCRSKRLEQKSEMEVQNNQLKIEINRLNKLIEKIQKENSMLKCLVNKSDDYNENNSKDKMISNKSLHQQQQQQQSNSQLTHLLSMPLVNKSSNNTNSLDHFNSYQTVSKC